MFSDRLRAKVLAGLVVLMHIYVVVLEMFLWNTPYGLRVFGSSAEFASASTVMSADQGPYNSFLATRLIWGLSASTAGRPVQLFFAGCVVVVGLYGAMSVGIRILFGQAPPAALAVAALAVAALALT